MQVASAPWDYSNNDSNKREECKLHLLPGTTIIMIVIRGRSASCSCSHWETGPGRADRNMSVKKIKIKKSPPPPPPPPRPPPHKEWWNRQNDKGCHSHSIEADCCPNWDLNLQPNTIVQCFNHSSMPPILYHLVFKTLSYIYFIWSSQEFWIAAQTGI